MNIINMHIQYIHMYTYWYVVSYDTLDEKSYYHLYFVIHTIYPIHPKHGWVSGKRK